MSSRKLRRLRRKYGIRRRDVNLFLLVSFVSLLAFGVFVLITEVLPHLANRVEDEAVRQVAEKALGKTLEDSDVKELTKVYREKGKEQAKEWAKQNKSRLNPMLKSNP